MHQQWHSLTDSSHDRRYYRYPRPSAAVFCCASLFWDQEIVSNNCRCRRQLSARYCSLEGRQQWHSLSGPPLVLSHDERNNLPSKLSAEMLHALLSSSQDLEISNDYYEVCKYCFQLQHNSMWLFSVKMETFKCAITSFFETALKFSSLPNDGFIKDFMAER